MLSYLVQHAFAGLWTEVWHFGIAIGIAILFAAAAYFSPIGRTYLIAGAIAFAMFAAGQLVGIHGGAARCVAQEKALSTFVGKTVQSTQTKKSRAAPDPWNSPNN